MKYKYLSTIFISLTIVLISILSVMTPDREVSELEGRKLQIIPPSIKEILIENQSIDYEGKGLSILEEESFSVEGILNGQYFSKWDSYFSDHILGRDYFVSIYSDIQQLFNRKQINDIYFGDDQFLFSLSDYNLKSDEELKGRAMYFNDIAKYYNQSQVYLVNLPEKYTVYEAKMPINNFHSPLKDEFYKLTHEIDENIEVIDMEQVLRGEEIYYYKTDHHWNMNGTYVGYATIINEIRKKFPDVPSAINRDEFKIERFDNYFVGSDGRRVGQLVDYQEDIELWRHSAQDDLVITIDGEAGKLYSTGYLSDTKFNNDYGVYMGGDNQVEIIYNNSIDNDLSIAIFGDSMSNPLVPLLCLNFKTVYSYDMRHYDGDIREELDQINPDILMFIGLTPNFLNEDAKIFNLD